MIPQNPRAAELAAAGDARVTPAAGRCDLRLASSFDGEQSPREG